MAKKIDKLLNFYWEGRNKRGLRVSGEMVALSPAIVQAELRRQNIDPIKVQKKSKLLFSREKKPNTMDVVVFTRHLATMISAGLPLIQSLDIIGRGHDKESMRKIIMTIKNDIAGGTTFSDGLSKHPYLFNTLFCSLMRSAEQSGTLDTMLKRIADYLEKSESLKKKIKKAMTYPAAIVVISLIVASILLVFVVPQFEKLFSSYGAELPLFTQYVMSLSRLLQNYWWLVFGLLGGGIYAFILAKRRVAKFQQMLDRTVLKVMVFGELIQKSIIARVTRTLSTNLAAGIPLVDALTTVSEISNNYVYKTALLQICEDVKTGQNIHTAMSSTNLFPHMVVQMIAVGEESGSLEDMLDKIASFYEEDVDNMVNNLSSLLEPLIMLLLGVIIGGFVLAMYLPIFKIGSVF